MKKDTKKKLKAIVNIIIALALVAGMAIPIIVSIIDI